MNARTRTGILVVVALGLVGWVGPLAHTVAAERRLQALAVNGAPVDVCSVTQPPGSVLWVSMIQRQRFV